MILIFSPLILYSPFLEMKVRSAFRAGREAKQYLIHEAPRYDPDRPMQFIGHPRIVEEPTRIRHPITELDETGL
jgi:hypothetical protein